MSPRKKRDGGGATPELPFGGAAPVATSVTGTARAMVPEDAGGARPGGVERVFLGWDAPALPAAAALLLERYGNDLSRVLVALPGGRAVRRLKELLARRAPPGWTPPRVVTQGELVDELLELPAPAAGRLARTLAWRRALDELGATGIERIARRASKREDGEARLRLAETIRTLHGELAPDGLDFAAIERAHAGREQERERWHVLARAQAAYRAALAECELCDPHEGRRAALAAGAVRTDRQVVLVGIADMNELLAGAVARLGARVTALVIAPEEHAAGFDALGRLVPAYWKAVDVPLDEGTWFVEEKPGDQADRAVDLVAGWAERRAAEEITIGIADEEVAPYLERRLRAAGARLRLAAGTPLARTRPFRLLRAVATLLERRSFADLAALTRHPDVAPRLLDREDPADVLDRYHEKHLPRVADARWHGEARDTRTITTLSQRLDALLGPLAPAAAASTAPLATWSAATRELLGRVYTGTLDPDEEPERVLAGALRAVGGALEELEGVPPALAPECTAHEALRLLLRALRSASVPPAPARAGEPTLEGLGWLELPLDDAPAMVVTGFNEGRVPQTIQGHAFLPNALRTELGLPDDDRRLARDVYATRVILAQRGERALVTGRRARSGDPLVPSRIAFQVPADAPEAILARVRRFLPPEVAPEPATVTQEQPVAPLARLAELPKLEKISVTSFRTFLKSPYVFYIERVLKLDSRHDRARELDPLQFGSFAHDVLQAFGQGDLRDSRSPGEIEAFLVDTAERLARERFGDEPHPAIALQVEQLKYRFRRAAQVQAWRRAQGWRILAAEFLVDGGFPFEVDGEVVRVTGKIDRIDAHDDGRWAILDYKTGDAGRDPDTTARGRDGWKDLQLPLYRMIAAPFAAEHGLAGAPELGYFQLGKDDDNVGIELVESWTDEDHAEAIECARDVVRRIRRGELFELGGAKAFKEEHVLRAILGSDLLHALGGEDDEA